MLKAARLRPLRPLCRALSSAASASASAAAPPPPPGSAAPTIPEDAVVFSGIQPTGVPHLGNYLGALRQWRRLQDGAPGAATLIYSVVDLHAVTMPQDAGDLRRWRRETVAALLAVGLDPARSVIFFQSAVQAHAELMWILSCTASVGSLSRMTQWKVCVFVSLWIRRPRAEVVSDAVGEAGHGRRRLQVLHGRQGQEEAEARPVLLPGSSSGRRACS